MVKKRFSKIVKWLLVIGAILLVAAGVCNYVVISSTRSQLYSDVNKIPYRKVGIVLGANKVLHKGENPYFKYRIDAATQLFKAGKIKHIIVSGDNHLSYYDEAKDMKDALHANGIPDSCITLDYAGFRTFDSMVRCKEIFGQDSVTVISQEFHNERAIFIANYYKMAAVGFNASNPQPPAGGEGIREFFAKFKAVLDLYVFHSTPHFLGEKVKI
jgi:SanA protein